MSCTIKKETSSSIKELDTLNRLFDEVILEEKEKYQLLILRDKVAKPNYDYVNWLELRIENQHDNGWSTTSKQDTLKRVLEKLVLWVDLLKNEDSSKPKQLSLFGEDEDSLEELPTRPDGCEGWEKYHKEYEKVSLRNIKKKYTFFELFSQDYYFYKGIDYRKSLPSKEEVRELYKQAILNGKDNQGRYDEFWWDNPSYIMKSDGLSDTELRDRLSSIRLFLVPYTDYFSCFIDDSFTDHSSEDKSSKISYRYYLDGTKLSTSTHHDFDTLDLPSYDGLFDAEFLEWVRNTLDVPYIEPMSDEDVLKENILDYFDSMLWYKRYDYDTKQKINACKNWKQFKADILSFCKDNAIDISNGGGSGFSIDGLSGNYVLEKKGSITITQEQSIRISLNRNIDDLEINNYGEYIVYRLSGDEIYKKAFDLFNKNQVANQVSLFDFLAA